MQPYFEDALTTLYHADNADVVDLLVGDRIITDPPFFPTEQVAAAARVLGEVPARSAAIFADWRANHVYSLSRDDKAGEVAWEFGWVSGFRAKARSGIRTTHNTIHIFGAPAELRLTEGTVLGRRPGFSSPRQCSYAAKSGHPYEKPVALLLWLLERIGAGVVIDPFAGSGSTAVAARTLGVRSVVVEREERWCEVAARRCEQLVAV